MFNFIKSAVEGREYAKFIFTKSLSDALSIFKSLAQEYGFTAEEASLANIACIYELYGSSYGIYETLAKSIEEGRNKYPITMQLNLPSIMFEQKDVWGFVVSQSEPNFITHKNVVGQVSFPSQKDEMSNKIVFIESADPGYDWIFTKNISGFVTKYGGVNSHMAIRASELGIPAVIGAGEVLYGKWASAQMIEINCLNKQVKVIR